MFLLFPGFALTHLSSVQSLSHALLFATPRTAAHQTSLSITNSWSLLNSCPSSQWSSHRCNYLLVCCCLLLLPSLFPSTRVFSGESVLSIRWPKYWSFSFSISPSNEYSRLISFRIDCPRDSQEYFPAPQFESTNPSTLTSVHDYWKNHSFDKTELCWKCNVSAL